VWVQTPEPACFELVGVSLDDAQVAHALDGLQQLYLDVSTKARLDDFANDLRALRRVAPPRPVAGGVVPSRWVVQDAPPFAAAEEALGEVLRGLEGLVVDIGAGPLRYVRSLDAAARSGRLQYVAVEPDAAHLRALHGAVHGGLLVRGVGEALPLPDGAADAAMFLRSWNHLTDVDSAVAGVARALRPGGRLIAVDNVAFGLLRTPAQLERAHAVPVSETPFEHYRNANADHCVASLRAHGGFDIERVDAVAPGRANQWLVVARRRAV
jgi:SAM-dependent methyltransferase